MSACYKNVVQQQAKINFLLLHLVALLPIFCYCGYITQSVSAFTKDNSKWLSVTHNPIDTLLDSDPYSGSLAQCWLSQKYAYLAFFQVQGQTFIGQYGNYSIPTEFGTPTLGLFLGVAPSFEFAKVLIFNSSNCLTLIHVNAAENPDRYQVISSLCIQTQERENFTSLLTNNPLYSFHTKFVYLVSKDSVYMVSAVAPLQLLSSLNISEVFTPEYPVSWVVSAGLQGNTSLYTILQGVDEGPSQIWYIIVDEKAHTLAFSHATYFITNRNGAIIVDGSNFVWNDQEGSKGHLYSWSVDKLELYQSTIQFPSETYYWGKGYGVGRNPGAQAVMVVAGNSGSFNVYTVYLNNTVLFGEVSSPQYGELPVLGAGLRASSPSCHMDVVVIFASKSNRGYNQLTVFAHTTQC